jgi:AcrR family transcriptional regulator
VARSGTKRRSGKEQQDDMRAAIVSAAIEALKADGYAGASARSIAARGDFSQAAVFYHFGSMRELLLAALDETSARRSTAYETEMTAADSVGELIAVARRIFHEDLSDGHLKVLVELISAAAVEPGLGDAVVERFEPWLALTEQTVAGALGEPVAGTVAFGVVALYLGLELLTHLTGDVSRADDLFSLAEQLLPMFATP